MSAPNGESPPGSATEGAGLAEWAQKSGDEWKAESTNSVKDSFEGPGGYWGKLISSLFSGFANLAEGIGDVIGNIVGAITGGSGFSLGHLSSWSSNVSTEIVNISSGQVQANTRLTKLEDVTGTGVITPIQTSVGGKDLVSFDRTKMQQHYYSGEDGTRYLTEVPAFVQGHGFVDVCFIRGGLDRKVVPKVVKIITGADASWFDVTAWYIGLYVYNPANGYFSKIWDSGNIAGVLSSQRQAYNIGTGLTDTYIQPDHLIGVASLQIATGLGRRPRGLGCIYQTGISEATGTTPFSPHAYFSGQSTLPASFFRSNISYSKDKIMWAAVGESS